MTPQSLNRPELDEPLLASHNEDTNAPASSDPTLLILDTPSGPPLDSHDPTEYVKSLFFSPSRVVYPCASKEPE